MRRRPAAEQRSRRATVGGGLGDVAIYIEMRTCNIMMNERASRPLDPHGLTAVVYITTMSLFSRPENLANPSELSDTTGETRGNMARICDELVDKGLIRRVPTRRIAFSLQALCCLKLALRLKPSSCLSSCFLPMKSQRMSNCRVDLCNS